MSEITIWSCGDVRAALELNNLLRGIGFKCRVHDTENRSSKVPWRYGQHIIVGSGRQHPPVANESKVMFLGTAALEYSTLQGGKLMRNPPGLQHPAETLFCTDTTVFGNKRASVVIESQADKFYFCELPPGWACAATNGRDNPVVACRENNIIIPYTLTLKSAACILEKILFGWESKRVDPTEYALKKAYTSARQQCTSTGQDVVVGYSGGLSSFVTRRVLTEALGRSRVIACHLETGLGKELDARTRSRFQQDKVLVLDVRQEVMGALQGEARVQERRRILNSVFTRQCKSVGREPYLAQGASYESLIRGVGQPAINTPGVLQPLENLSMSEIELVGERFGYKPHSASIAAAGFSDFIRGPFSADALRLCKKVDRACEEYAREFNADNCHTNRQLLRVEWELDVHSKVPRVHLWLFMSTDGRSYLQDISHPRLVSKLADKICREVRCVTAKIEVFINV